MKKLLLLITILLAAPTADAMPQTDKIVDVSTNVAYWTIAAAPFVAMNLVGQFYFYILRKDIHKKSSPIHPNMQSLVRNSAAKVVGTEHANKIRVVYSPWGIPFAMDTDIIGLSVDYQQSSPEVMHEALFNGKITPELEQELTGVIQHEAGHLFHKDMFKTSIVRVCLPAIIAYTVKSLSETNETRTTLRSMMRIPAALAAYALTNTMLSFYSKRYEQRADESISNDAVSLESLKKSLAHLQKQYQTKLLIQNVPFIFRYACKPYYDSNGQLDVDNLPPMLRAIIEFYLHPQHPSYRTRIEKLEKRIAKLKEAEEALTKNGVLS